MKRIALLVVSMMMIAGCGQATKENRVETGVPVNFYFVSDTPRGFKLFSEVQNLSIADDMNLHVIANLVSGKVAPLDPQYSNLWGTGNTVNSVTLDQEVATVDLGKLNLNVGAEGEQQAINQIVWTLTSFAPEIASVEFTVNGKTVESLAGHVDTTVEFKRAIDYEVLNPIQISSINQGAELTSPVTISGQACTFEANVVWKLSLDGKTVREGFTTASSSCPERGYWSITIEDLGPGKYTIAAIEYSAEDGSLFAIDDKDFIIK